MNSIQKLRLRWLKSRLERTNIPPQKAEVCAKGRQATKAIKDEDTFMFI
ncbi:hypothetical protein ACPX19_11530 [Winogradskyella sp. HB-48]